MVRAGIVKIYSNNKREILWDWAENAEYRSGESLDFKTTVYSMDETTLRSKLREKGIEHLFD